MADPVTAPAHYAGDGEVDCRRAMESMHAGWRTLRHAKQQDPGAVFSLCYFVTCAFKYIWRFSEKGGMEDLKKARQCLDYAIERWER